MKWVYKSGVWGYASLLKGISPFNSKAAKWVKGRSNLTEQLSGVNTELKWIWFHVASLGEFEQAKPVMDRLIKENPSFSLLITFFSPSGYEVRKDYENSEKVMYLPLESEGNVRQFLDVFQPKLVVFVKYDFWFEYMSQVINRNIPLVFISATFRKDQIFFRRVGSWFLNQLSPVDRFFVQDENSLELLKEFGITQAEMSGDTRFDRVEATFRESEMFPLMEEFTANSRTLIFGSAWDTEMNFAIDFINNLPKGWKVILAPHEINVEKIDSFRSKINATSVLFSEASASELRETPVMVLNTIGHLARAYKYASVAVVGGGFTDGIHNILEPLAFGVPVAFGPMHDKFWEGKAAIENNVGFEINNLHQFNLFISQFTQSENNLKLVTFEARKFIKERLGATDMIVNYLNIKLK